MNNFKGYMIISDMDGSLLNSKHKVSEQNRDAIDYFIKNGGLFTVATGRMKNGIARYMKDLQINAPAILYNGALIYDYVSQQEIWKKTTHDIDNIVQEILDKFHAGVEVFYSDDVYVLRDNDITCDHRMRENFIPKFVDKAKDIPKPWYKVIIADSPERLKIIEDFLKQRMDNFRMVYSEPRFLELLNKDVSKGCALIALSKMLNIPTEKIISIGDNMNDYEMIEVSGMGFVVENANPLLKKHARYNCCHHDEHALAYVVEYLRNM